MCYNIAKKDECYAYLYVFDKRKFIVSNKLKHPRLNFNNFHLHALKNS